MATHADIEVNVFQYKLVSLYALKVVAQFLLQTLGLLDV